MKKYQENLSLDSPILLDITHKQPKVDKVLAILRDNGALENPQGIAIDIGCSIGFFASALTPFFSTVFGLDIDVNALGEAQKLPENAIDNLEFLTADSLNLPFEDNSVDLILCNHTYEHVPDADILFSEIQRVLKPGGRCYLGAASRLILVEPHYHLLFLSWLPKPLAHKYMQVMGKGDEYYEMLRTYWGIKRMIKAFDVTDYTLQVLKNPATFGARDMIPEGSWIEKTPTFLWRMIYPLLPTYIFILKKVS
jgi:ubiquinone/menaquinone biosynthesis C-methylase UbiE